MRESCSCGAAIHTVSYRRALTWRFTHRHGSEELHELETETDFPTGFQLEPEEEVDD